MPYTNTSRAAIAVILNTLSEVTWAKKERCLLLKIHQYQGDRSAPSCPLPFPLERVWERMRLDRLAGQTITGAMGHVKTWRWWGFGESFRGWEEDGCVHGGTDFSCCLSVLSHSTLNSGRGQCQWSAIPNGQVSEKGCQTLTDKDSKSWKDPRAQ